MLAGVRAGIMLGDEREWKSLIFHNRKRPHISCNENAMPMSLIIVVSPALDCGGLGPKASVIIVGWFQERCAVSVGIFVECLWSPPCRQCFLNSIHIYFVFQSVSLSLFLISPKFPHKEFQGGRGILNVNLSDSDIPLAAAGKAYSSCSSTAYWKQQKHIPAPHRSHIWPIWI